MWASRRAPPSHFILATGLTVTMVPKRNFVPVQVMVVFIPNEILLLVRNFILVSCKLKMNFVLDCKLQIVLSGASGA